jgi:hypothetical protein
MLSSEDRDRLKVLHEVERGHLTQGEAGQQLRVSERWIRKLLARIRRQGDAGGCTDCEVGRQIAGLGRSSVSGR